MLGWGKKSAVTDNVVSNVAALKKQVLALPNPEPGSFLRSDVLPSNAKNTATEEDLKWQMMGSGATETMTFYMALEGGVFAFVQMAYSTLGLSPNVGLTCRIYLPDGTKDGKTINHTSSAFKLSNNNLSASCGEEMAITYNPETRGYAVKFVLSKDTMIDVVYTPLEPAFKIGDGRVVFGKGSKDGFVQAQFMPKATVEGTMMCLGRSVEVGKGQGLFHHALQVKPQSAAKWNFINFQSEKDALMLYEFEMPQKNQADVNIVSQGCLVRNGRTIAALSNNRAVHVQKVLDPVSHYEIPTQIFVSWAGKTVDDNLDVSVELGTVLKHKLDTIDVLAELPYLLRKFIQTFITAPFLFLWYEQDVVAKVTINGETEEIEGNAFIECSFLCKE
ncbi:putative cell survival pathways protein [Rhizoclosmatium sp. JEL0117]|nr:putative cell survival pathways protein [Rhizoclosmatium sp. JEL0117]